MRLERVGAFSEGVLVLSDALLMLQTIAKALYLGWAS